MSTRIYGLQFWLLCLSSYLFFSSFTMILPELPGYLSRMGGEEYLGLIISLFTLTAGISRPFSGKLTDKWGRIPVMVIGAVVSAVGSIMYPFISGVYGFLLIRLFHGFSTGFKPTATAAYVADLVPIQRRGEALGMLSMFGTIGTASAPVIGSTIYLQFGINTLFYISSAFAMLSVLILVGMKETLNNNQPFSFSLLKISKNEIYEPSVMVPSVVMLLTTFSFGTVVTLSPDFSEYLGINNKGLFFSFFTGSSLLVRIIGGKLSDRFGRRFVLKISTSLLFLSMMLIGFSQSPTQFFAGAFFFGLGYGLNSPTLFAWTIDLSPEQNRGKGISTLFIALEIGIGLGALITGSLYQGVDSRFPIIFGCSAIFSFLAFIYVIFFTADEQAAT
jgi:MFS family permease